MTARGRPTRAAAADTPQHVPVPLGSDSPGHGRHMAGKAETGVSVEGSPRQTCGPNPGRNPGAREATVYASRSGMGHRMR